uniref:Ribosome-binding factor A n=1 Tax=Heliothis virescens TaxID=7102 RepID=A0A2A4K9Q5_HELVI
MISFHRLYHLSCVTFSLKKQGLKLCKMVNPKSKRQWYPTQQLAADALPSVKSLTKQKYEPSKRGQRRTAMLNKMFMKHITDMLSTGTVAMDVVGRGIEISKVNVTPDLNTVNVFWVCKGDASDAETEKVLNKVAGSLRHELSTLRVMGEIPYIVFVKDKQETNLVDLDRRLAMADYGEDYVPTDMGHMLKSEFILNTKLSPEVKAKIKKLEDDLPIFEDPIPEMTHNVFGLDHSKIMSRLLAARKKTRDAWSTLDTENDVISYRVSPNKVPESVSSQRKELADFLLQRQILEKKIQKRLKDSRQDLLLTEQAEETEEVEDDDEYYEDDDEESYNYYGHTDLSSGHVERPHL